MTDAEQAARPAGDEPQRCGLAAHGGACDEPMAEGADRCVFHLVEQVRRLQTYSQWASEQMDQLRVAHVGQRDGGAARPVGDEPEWRDVREVRTALSINAAAGAAVNAAALLAMLDLAAQGDVGAAGDDTADELRIALERIRDRVARGDEAWRWAQELARDTLAAAAAPRAGADTVVAGNEHADGAHVCDQADHGNASVPRAPVEALLAALYNDGVYDADRPQVLDAVAEVRRHLDGDEA